MTTWIILVLQLALLGFYLWGMSRAARRVPGPPPWPLRLITDATGAPRLSASVGLGIVSLVLLVLLLATTPTRAQQRHEQQQQQLDRIEQLLRDIRDDARTRNAR